jgi:CO/xanthine dehydrogenase Mo-binding subunit
MSTVRVDRLRDLRGLGEDALTALEQAVLSRRRFLRESGALIVTFGAAGLAAKVGYGQGTTVAQSMNGPGNGELDSWIAIAADGRVTAYTGKCELGQGLYTAQTQLVAEELAVLAPRKLQSRQPGAGSSHGTRNPGAPGFSTAERTGRSARRQRQRRLGDR